MTNFDPFADAPANDEMEQVTDWEPAEEEADYVVETPEVQKMTDQNYTTVILKGGDAYGAPSVSVRGASIKDLYQHYEDSREQLRKLMEMVAFDNQGFAKSVNNSGKSSSGGGSNASAPEPQKGQPPESQQAPNGERQWCQHGERRYKSGISQKTGNPYAMFVCTQPQGPDQCKPARPQQS